MKNFLKKYGHAWILSFGLVYLVWFLYLEHTVTNHYHVVHVRWDDYIPFNEYFIIPYLLWFSYVTAAIIYFFFTNKREYYQFCICLFSGMILSLVICTFYHNGTNFRPVLDPDKNLCSWLVAKLYKTDTCTNVFPSVHVYNSICTHIAIRRNGTMKKHRWLIYGSFFLMTAICLSTVFLKQHSVVDGFGALLLAYPIYYMVYGMEQREEKKAARKALS